MAATTVQQNFKYRGAYHCFLILYYTQIVLFNGFGFKYITELYNNNDYIFTVDSTIQMQ